MLLVFDIDERLVTTLKNDGIACPYFNAVHKEQLNGENTLTFAVPAGHVDTRYVIEGNLVMFKCPDNNWQLFEIKKPKDVHDLHGLIRTAYCENAFYELLDDFITDIRPTNVSPHLALTQALYGTRWQVGTVTTLGQNSTNFYYESALSAIQKVQKTWGGELRFHVVVTDGVIVERYVDLLAQRGTDTGKQFVRGKDVEDVRREIDMTTLATAMYGRGKGVEVETGGYGRRLTFADVEWSVAAGNPVDKPLGQEWVGDPDALAQRGRPGNRHRFDVFEDGDETDPATLLQKTWDALQVVKNPRVTYSLNVVILEQLSGHAHEKVRLGDTVRVIDREFSPALLVSARVIEVNRDLLRPENTKIALGNFVPTVADQALEQEQLNRDIRDKAGVWDRSTQFNPDGTLNTGWLTNKMVGLQNELQLANSAVTAAKLAVAAVVAEKIAEHAVEEAKIAVGAITRPKIADEAVNADKIADASITAVKLAQEAVNSAHIYAGAVTSAKIAASAIMSWHIKSGEITVPKTNFPRHQIF